jgi:hypothetical protein
MKVYLLEGQTGEYDSWRSWSIITYTDKEQAENHRAKAQDIADTIVKDLKDMHGDEWVNVLFRLEPKNPYDHKFELDYTGVEYNIREINLVNCLSAYINIHGGMYA